MLNIHGKDLQKFDPRSSEDLNDPSEEKLKKGYLEMSEINLEYAEDCVTADEEQFVNYEKFLRS